MPANMTAHNLCQDSKDSKDEIPLWEARTGKARNSIAVTPVSELPEIVKKARAAGERWAALPLAERSKALMRVVDMLYKKRKEYTRELSLLNGKDEGEAFLAEIFPVLSVFRFFAKKGAKYISPEKIHLSANPIAKSILYYEPLGVVGIISPWNYPFMLSIFDMPAALMAGNAVILKSSEHSAWSGQMIEKLMAEAGLPTNLVQCIYGYGDVGAALIRSGIDKICFTGSTKTGQLVYKSAADAMIPCDLEMGGKDPALILEDADLDQAVPGILWAAFANCGQACASIEKVYVPEGRKAEFLQKAGDFLSRIPDSNFGTMNVLFQKDLVKKQLEDALARGAKVAAEKKLESSDNPYRMSAAILSDVPEEAACMKDETFGPLLPVVTYRTVDEALERMNRSEYGLTASVWTKNFARGEELAQKIQAGVVTINDHMITKGAPESPWVGHKRSGLGFAGSYHSLRAFCKLKYVYHDRGMLKFKFWRYPVDAEKQEWIDTFVESQFDPSPVRKIVATLKTLPKLLFG
jgi:acyl-CoA reductase-like NAD-dependent aldehyde dehydrogenase